MNRSPHHIQSKQDVGCSDPPYCPQDSYQVKLAVRDCLKEAPQSTRVALWKTKWGFRASPPALGQRCRFVLHVGLAELLPAAV